ncbi:B-4DMT family transporter [Mycobacterium sp. NPDC003449]
MSKWLLRGVVFATAMVIVRLVQGALINASPGNAIWFSIALLVVFGIGVAIWGLLDGRSDARRNPDPDRRADLAMTWLLAGLCAGILSGLVAWFIGLFYKSVYTDALLNEVTTFAAFTALLVFLVAVAGVTIGRWLVDRGTPQVVRHHGSHADDGRADTDVFAAVNANGGQDSTDTTATTPVDYPDQPRQN